MRTRLQFRGVFVDTGAYGAMAIERDEYHQIVTRMTRWLLVNHRSIITTNFIVAETHALILARAGRGLALRALQLIEENTDRIERVTVEDELEARRILEQHADKTYSYTDATSFAVMRRLGLNDVFTFDRHFEQFGFSPLKPH
jgi:predicted nucleic acid-binding protein